MVFIVALFSASLIAQGTHSDKDTDTVTGQGAGGPRQTQPPPQPPLRVRVSQGVSEALLIRKVDPIYPEEARRNHVSGFVVMSAIISEKGDVLVLRPVSGDPSLTPAALDAVRQWKYKPYQLNGRPVQLETLVTVAFKLNPR